MTRRISVTPAAGGEIRLEVESEDGHAIVHIGPEAARALAQRLLKLLPSATRPAGRGPPHPSATEPSGSERGL